MASYTPGRRAAAPRSGFDPGTRMLTFVLATETPCPSFRFDGPELVEVQEVLVAEGCVNLSTMDGPVLDSHDRSSIDKVLGKIRSARVEGTEVVCEALLGDRCVPYFGDIRDGIIDKMSAGYTCIEETLDRSTSPYTVRVTKWSADEGSMVPIPADKSALIRAERAARAAAAPPSPEASMTPEALDAAFKAFGDSFATGLAGFRAALTTTTAPAPAGTPATPAAPAGERAAAPADGKDGKGKDGGARAGKREDDDEGGEEDGGEDEGERAAAIADIRSAMAGFRSEQFEAAVKIGAPVPALRQVAYRAMRAAPVRKDIGAEARAAAGAERKHQTLVPFSKRAAKAAR